MKLFYPIFFCFFFVFFFVDICIVSNLRKPESSHLKRFRECTFTSHDHAVLFLFQISGQSARGRCFVDVICVCPASYG